MRKRLFILLLVCCLIAVAVSNPVPTQAAGAISPPWGVVGTHINVFGLTAGATYSIKWDGFSLGSGVVPADGNISFEAPETFRGPHSVTVESPFATIALSSSFSIIPAIYISPDSGPGGTTVTILGTGFAPYESVQAAYDSIAVTQTISANRSGSWTGQFISPNSPAGYHYVTAYGNFTSPNEVNYRTFTVTPTVRINPASGCVGTQVTVSGTGFGSLEPGIKVTFGDQVVRSGIASQGDGSWNTTFMVPPSSRNDYIVNATGNSTTSVGWPNAVFTVMASAFINPSTAFVGDKINIIGKGFANNEQGITITYDGRTIGNTLVADSTGNWVASIEVPPDVNGTHVLDAFGSITTSLNCAGTTLTVKAKVALNPDGGNVGDVVAVTGSGFKGQKPAAITYGNTPIVSDISTDARGSFSTSFKAPGGRSGQIEVGASDQGGAKATSVFSMETIPPPVPLLFYPTNGETVGIIGSSQVDFEWTQVFDPSGVYYTLEVSAHPSFSPILIRISDLTSPQYELAKGEALPYGQYYWRVRAIDGASNASAWTNPFLVKVSYMTFETFIIIVAALIIIIVLALVLPRVLRPKLSKKK
jgi:hypothetical protein